MKRITYICIATVMVVFFFGVGPASAADVKLVLDSKYVYTDTAPVIVDGRVLVPLRAIFEALGGAIEWDPKEQQIYGSKGVKRVWLKIDDPKAYFGNRQETVLDVPARIIDGRTMVPLRFIAESLGCETSWDAENQTVFLKSPKTSEIGDVFNAVKPSMVLVETEGKLGRKGSGFFISGDSVITNAHIVTGAFDIQVKAFDDKYYRAQIDRIDINLDIAVLKVDPAEQHFVGIYPYRLSKDVKVGQGVIAVGSPFGLENTVTSGIVSGIRDEKGVKLIQMTAPISSGNSGGPLLTMDGEVIGVNTMQIVIGQNLNFALPMEDYESVKSKDPLVLDADMKDFIEFKYRWNIKRSSWMEDLDRAEEMAKGEKYAEAASLLKKKVLPEIEENRAMISSFSSGKNDITALVTLFDKLTGQNYAATRCLADYYDKKSQQIDDYASLAGYYDAMDEFEYLYDQYTKKRDELWKKYYQ